MPSARRTRSGPRSHTTTSALPDRYVEQTPDNEPERLHADSLSETRSGPVGLLRDLQDVHMLATFVESTWTLVAQGGSALSD